MKRIKTMNWLGLGGALLLPSLAIAALDIPNTFAAGDPVSAAEMNANFDAVKVKVEEIEAAQGTAVRAPVALKVATLYCGATCPASGNDTIESVEHSANTGAYDVNFSVPFGAQPVCTCTPQGGSRVCYVNFANPSAATSREGVRVNVTNLSGVAADGGFVLMCIAPP